MIIKYNSDGRIDFEAPIYMTEEQREKFIQGMKKIFGIRIKIENIIENKKEIKKRKGEGKRKYDIKQLSHFAKEINNKDIANIIGKTEFAVQMKRGVYLKEYMEWARKKRLSKLDEESEEAFFKEVGIK